MIEQERVTASQDQPEHEKYRHSDVSVNFAENVVNKPLVLELIKGEYLDRRENILLVGALSKRCFAGQVLADS